MPYPFLSLKNMTMDAVLVQRIPRALAYYHLALPVAEDEEEITLVMAYPNNPKVLALFADYFQRRIVPVQGDSAEIRTALDSVYAQHLAHADQRLLIWSTRDTTQTLTYAQTILPNAVYLADDQQAYDLAVVDSDLPTALQFLRSSTSSVLLLNGEYPPLRKILIVLQGHSPDKQTLVEVQALALHAAAEVTLLGIAAPMKRRTVHGIATLLNSANPAGQHFAECLAEAQQARLQGHFKLRQGVPDAQIAAEFVEGGYDLLAIAVETHGGFVQRILQAIDGRHTAPILAVRPQR